jgi:hypothetical protein
MNWKLSNSAPLYGCAIALLMLAVAIAVLWLGAIAIGTAFGAVVW